MRMTRPSPRPSLISRLVQWRHLPASGSNILPFGLKLWISSITRYSSPDLELNSVEAKSIQNFVMRPGIQPRNPITHGLLPLEINSATGLPECSLIGTSLASTSTKSPNVMAAQPADFPSAEIG